MGESYLLIIQFLANLIKHKIIYKGIVTRARNPPTLTISMATPRPKNPKNNPNNIMNNATNITYSNVFNDKSIPADNIITILIFGVPNILLSIKSWLMRKD